MTRTCSVEGCEEKHRARGFCARHYQQEYRLRRPVLHPEYAERHRVRERLRYHETKFTGHRKVRPNE